MENQVQPALTREEKEAGYIKKRAAKMFSELQVFLPPEKAKAAGIWCVAQLEAQYEHLFPKKFESEEEKEAAGLKFDEAMKNFDKLRAAIKAF